MKHRILFYPETEEAANAGGGAPERPPLAEAPLDDEYFENDSPPNGLAARMAEALEEEPKPAKPEKIQKPEKEIEEEEEEDFPTLGEDEIEEEPEKDLDEKEFDAETDKIIKALEKKGHPGEVYKDLRRQLKEAKLASTQPKEDPKLAQKIADLETKAQELEGLREKVKSLSSKSAKLMVEESKEYKEKIAEPQAAMLSAVDEIAEAHGIEVDVILDAITESKITTQDKMLEALKAKVGPRQIGRIERMADDYKVMLRLRKGMLDNAEQVLEQQKKQAEEHQKQERERFTENFRRQQKNTMDRYATRVPGFTDEDGGLTPEGKKALRTGLSIDPDKISEGDLAFALFSAQALPHLVKRLKQAESELASKGRKSTKTISGRASKQTAEKSHEPVGILARMSQDFDD